MAHLYRLLLCSEMIAVIGFNAAGNISIFPLLRYNLCYIPLGNILAFQSV